VTSTAESGASGLVVPTTVAPPAGPAIGTHSALLGDAPPAAAPPARIEIPRLEVSAPVAAVSVTADGELAVPPTTTVAAWYSDGPTPGSDGSAVIAAHVDYNGKPGVFFQLDQLAVGDRITVVDTAGAAHLFAVVSRQRYAKVALPTDQIFRKVGQPGLTLVTCGGQFRPAQHSYADNVVVDAVPVTA
jgi:LPXTG-site transpeptidase (sortase) family protein